MVRLSDKQVVTAVYIISRVMFSGGVPWQDIKCAADVDARVPEGTQPDVSRFPWIGVVQHSFYLGGKTRFAITTGILIHPGWVLASAEDIAKIPVDSIQNNTKFIAWKTEKEKYALEVYDYVLHPDFVDKVTMATVALLELYNWASAKYIAPVPPVCVPAKGGGAFDDLYAVKMTDETKEIEKQVYKVDFVSDQDCEEFYYRSQLTYKKMKPQYQLCAATKQLTAPCVWDAGVALITRQNWGYWVLLGFGVRGPGCGAPARFINIHSHLSWMDEVIMRKPMEDQDDVYAFYLRQMSPYKLIMYKADVKIPKEHGQCERKDRGGVLFKDSAEILMNKNFGQGYYYTEVWQIAQFQCAVVQLETSSRTNAAVWLEHHCHMEIHGLAPGMKQPDHSKKECFYYFKSTAYIEFRFFFSFKASLEVTLYGTEDLPRWIPNPFMTTETTEIWWPTDVYLRLTYFVPFYLGWYNL